MLATFLIELILAVYILWRYKANAITKLVVAILGLLAVFQLAEYTICGGLGISGDMWSRIGFIAITMLPPLGLHLASEISGETKKYFVWAGYTSAIMFSTFFMVVADAVNKQTCGGNYIIYVVHQDIAWLYGVYYYGLLIAAVIYAWLQLGVMKNNKNKKALILLLVGYILFLAPTTTVNLINPATIQAIPSIMCGFAVLLAFVLSFGVVPEVATQKVKNKNILEKLRLRS